MSTSTDGARPSVPPGSDGGPGPLGPQWGEPGPDGTAESDAERTEPSDPAWLQGEIQRRMADRPAGRGRHARPDSSMEETTPDLGRVPRHSVSTPGPGAAPPRAPERPDTDAVSRARAARPDDVWSRPPQPTAPQVRRDDASPWVPADSRAARPTTAGTPDSGDDPAAGGGPPPVPERPIGSPGLDGIDARYARPVPRRTVPRAFARGARRAGPREGPAVFGGPGFAEPAPRQPHARPGGPGTWPGRPPADPPPRTVADAVREAGLRRADVPVEPRRPATDPGREDLRYASPRDPGPGDPAPPTATFRAAPETEALRTTPADVAPRTEARPALRGAPPPAPATEALPTSPPPSGAPLTQAIPVAPDGGAQPSGAPVTQAIPVAPDGGAQPSGAPVTQAIPVAPDGGAQPSGAPVTQAIPVAPDRGAQPSGAPVTQAIPVAPDRGAQPSGAPVTQAIPVAPDRRAQPARDPRDGPAPAPPLRPSPRVPGPGSGGLRPPGASERAPLVPPGPGAPPPGFLPPRPDLDLPDATGPVLPAGLCPDGRPGDFYGGVDDARYDEGFDLDDRHEGDGSAVLWSATTPPLSPRQGAAADLDVLAPRTPAQAGAAPAQRADPDVVDGPELYPEGTSVSRVKVVLSERRGGAHPVRTVVDIQEGGAVGELLRSNLISSQLAVALRFAIGAGLTLGLLPLLFALFPALGRFEILGIRLPWLLLGGLVYPFLWAIGLWHMRTAERVEKNFADHVQD